MASISTRSSVLAIVPEVTEGVPVSPTAATQYTPIQDDFQMKPDFNVLENNELTASIGKRKRILGSEKPSASFTHYVKHSGVEGQAPDWSPAIKSAFGGQKTATTEYPLVAASTVSLLKFNTGIGANFERGQGVLVKDPVNGSRIRVIDSVTGDNALLGFNLPAAPAAAVKTGKCVMFKPAESGHIPLSLWHYLGNGGNIQLMAGAKCTQFNLQAQAGELVTASLNFEGVQFFFDPIEITASKTYFEWTDDTGTYSVSVAVQMYKDPADLIDALLAAISATATTVTFTITYDSLTGKFKIASTGTLLTLKWNTGPNTVNSIATKLGFSAAADSTGAAATTGYTGANAIILASPQTPTPDNSDPVAAKGQEVMLGDSTDFVCFDASEVSFDLNDTRTEIKSICAASGVSGSQITGREVKVTVKALLSQYDASKFSRFRKNTDTKFQYSFGPKAGNNWVPGKSGYAYVPSMTLTSFQITDDNGLATLELEGEAFVDAAGSGEAYFGFL